MKLIEQPVEVVKQTELPTISHFLDRKPEESTRSIEFKKNKWTNGAIECRLFISFNDDRSSLSVTGAASTEGDAFILAVKALERSGVTL